MTPAEAREAFNPFDLKRLQAYANNMLDYHVILDLLPSLATLYFQHRFPRGPDGPLRLSAVQGAVLCAVGLQRKQVEDVEVSRPERNDACWLSLRRRLTSYIFENKAELKLPVSQVLALFVKGIRKFAKALEDLRKQEIGAELPSGSGSGTTAARTANGGGGDQKMDAGEEGEGGQGGRVMDASQVAREMEAELEEEGDEVVRSVRERQRDLIDSLDLDQCVLNPAPPRVKQANIWEHRYAIAGKETDWHEAEAKLARARERAGETAATVVSVPGVKRKAEGGADDGGSAGKRKNGAKGGASPGGKKMKKAKR
jgi:N-acetyltransferase 10